VNSLAMLRRSLQPLGLFLTRTKAGRLLVFLSLPLALAGVAAWLFLSKPTYELPIFDAQVHYNQDVWSRVPVKAVINTAQELYVPWLLVASLPNAGTWRLHRADPGRVIPMMVPYTRREERETWFADPNIGRYIEDEINRYPYQGIGEFFLFDGQVDTPVVHRMLELAAERDLVLHARSDPAAIRQLFAIQPGLRIIWAHGGMFVRPEQISLMLDNYRNLWVEISHRIDVAPDGVLDEKWRACMLRHPDRILLGSGTYNTQYWYEFRYILNRYRDWLPQLPPSVAEKIAWRNGAALFGLNTNIKAHRRPW
jgi:hypothetical protein